MINSVSITLRKDHTNGEQTVREVFFDVNTFKEFSGAEKMIYLNKDDTDRTQWLNYEYSVNWQLRNGGQYQTDWLPANVPFINLYTPYKHHVIDIMGDMDLLKEQDVIAVLIQVEYPFFDDQKKEKLIIKPFNEENEESIDTILPNDVDEVDYELTWVYKSGEKVKTEGKDGFGIILIDEIPESK